MSSALGTEAKLGSKSYGAGLFGSFGNVAGRGRQFSRLLIMVKTSSIQSSCANFKRELFAMILLVRR